LKNEQYKIELSDEAEQDFDESYKYYSNKSEKVAENFRQQVNSCFEKIANNPEGYPKTEYGFRKYVMKKFPFVIYFRVKVFDIGVVAIFRASRNPEKWKSRNNE